MRTSAAHIDPWLPMSADPGWRAPGLEKPPTTGYMVPFTPSSMIPTTMFWPRNPSRQIASTPKSRLIVLMVAAGRKGRQSTPAWELAKSKTEKSSSEGGTSAKSVSLESGHTVTTPGRPRSSSRDRRSTSADTTVVEDDMSGFVSIEANAASRANVSVGASAGAENIGTGGRASPTSTSRPANGSSIDSAWSTASVRDSSAAEKASKARSWGASSSMRTRSRAIPPTSRMEFDGPADRGRRTTMVANDAA